MKRNVYLLTMMTIASLSCSDKTETFTVSEKSLNEAVYASGKIMPLHYDDLRSGTIEQVIQVSVKPGDTVRAGQVLVVLGAPGQADQVDLLKQQLTLAKRNANPGSAVLNQLQNEIQLARERYLQDSLNAQNYSELAKEQAVSEKDALDAKLRTNASYTQLKNLRQQYKAKENELSAKLLTVREQLGQVEQQQWKRVLASNLNGIVYNVNLREGEQAGPGETILLVGSPGAFKLELLVDERDIRKIALGQKVIFETDAFPDQQFSAEISKLDPVLQQESRSFKVEAVVSDTADFYPQSSVEANVVIREQVNALLVPASFLLPGDSVLIKGEKDEKKTINVITGIHNDNWVEIKSGLKAGDVLLKK